MEVRPSAGALGALRRLLPLTYTLLAAIFFAIPGIAKADDIGGVVVGKMSFVDDRYRLTLPRQFLNPPEAMMILGRLNLLDLQVDACGTVDCVDTDAVRQFFASPRLVTLSYVTINVHNIKLKDQTDVDSLLTVVRQAYPPSPVASPTATFGPYVVMVNGKCKHTVEADAILSQYGFGAAPDKVDDAIQGGMGTCENALMDARDNAIDNANRAAEDKQRRIDAVRAEAAERNRNQQAAAMAAEQRDDQRRSEQKSIHDAVVSLPSHRHEIVIALARCVKELSAIDCATVQGDAYSDYIADRFLNDNRDLCQDRSDLAVAMTYQAQLQQGYLTRFNASSLDETLGEIIDNCPEKAQAAIKMRHLLHGIPY